MDTKTCQLFAEYNKKTNSEMDSIIQSLTSSQWEQNFEGYFNSVKSVSNHIYICDFNWLKRFSKLRQYDFIKNPMFNSDLKFGTIVLEEVEDYLKSRKLLDEIIIQFVNEIIQSELSEYLVYTDSHNHEYKSVFGGLILHFFNHQTHHRGLISFYLENMGFENDFSNLSYMV